MDRLINSLTNGVALLCSDCFQDNGLKIQAQKIGLPNDNNGCENCFSNSGKKLTNNLIEELAHSFFVSGTTIKQTFGAAPRIEFKYSSDSVDYFEDFPEFSESLRKDMELFGVIGLKFFYYGPRLWMIGENEPLKALQEETTRKDVIKKILKAYPIETLDTTRTLYRLRKKPSNEKLHLEYDTPPAEKLGSGRFDSIEFPVLYCGQEIETCIHECRTTVEDDLYLAILKPSKNLTVLNLTEALTYETSEFESLDMAVHMLFMDGKNSYEVSKEIAVAIKNAGLDGIIYPSYFSSIQTGAQPLETIGGVSIRMLSSLKKIVEANTKANVALFGRPVEEGKVTINCISRIVLRKVTYDFDLGPIETAAPECPT